MTRNRSPLSLARRSLLRGLVALPVLHFAGALKAMASEPEQMALQSTAHAALAALEAGSDGRIGLALLDADGNAMLQYRAEERFPLCSTFKMMLAATILQRGADDARFLTQRIRIKRQAMVDHSPETEKHLGKQMRIDELCAAAMEYGDNAAANLLLEAIGGPMVVTAYARSIGDDDFMLVHNETNLGAGIPGDYRDTTSPGAMARSLQRLALANVLDAPQRDKLVGWMRNNKTGNKRIRAGVPVGWQVGDRTGSGDFGTTNDIAVLYRPNQPPLILAIYFTQKQQNAPLHDEVVAQAARIAIAQVDRP
ncbi:MAG TPA: class A beta-lactamase [Burkholderiaceae bacterium]|jgi:beta-lactamase class A